MATPNLSLALVFKFTLDELKSGNQSIRDEYSRLLKACSDAGLVAAGKRWTTPGAVVVFVDCLNPSKKTTIVNWEQCVFVSPWARVISVEA